MPINLGLSHMKIEEQNNIITIIKEIDGTRLPKMINKHVVLYGNRT